MPPMEVELNSSPHTGGTIGILCQLKDFSPLETEIRCLTFLNNLSLSFDLHMVNFSSFIFPKKEEEKIAGISAVVLLAESHAAIHTWPERNTFRLILDSCKEVSIEKLLLYLQKVFQVETIYHWEEQWKIN